MSVFSMGIRDRIRNTFFISGDSEFGSALFTKALTATPRPRTNHLYSYLTFLAFAVVYFWNYLPLGFTVLDDAYLMSLGQRVSSGESIYVDFYYLRTPLSPLIQSLWFDLLGESYTFLLGRIFWAVQLCASIAIFSIVYRRWLPAVALAVVLCATLVYSSLLFAFPWYTYDGMFFTALFALFAFQRRMFFAGVCAGLAFLSKQGFAALLPLYFLLNLIETKSAGESLLSWAKSSAKMTLGALVVVVIMVLALDASLALIWNNVFVLPKSINELPLAFLIYQDLPEVFLDVWPIAIPLFLIIVFPLRFHWKVTALSIWLFMSWTMFNELSATLPRVMTLVGFAAIGWFFVRNLGRIRGVGEDFQLRQFLKISALALTAMYVSGFNYNGWVFSYIGAVISLPVLILWFSAEDESSPSMSWGPMALASAILVLSLAVHHGFPYKSSDRQDMSVPFAIPALAGIRADSTTVAEIDGLVTRVRARTNPGEAILAFPDPASLSFLAERLAWGPIQWFYQREFDSAMAEQSVQLLSDSPPALVVINDPLHVSQTPRFDLLYEAIYDNFQVVDTVGPFHILIPICVEDSLRVDVDD